ncbi:hypothetical protein VSDG_01038 [Cytospora chrysosperma]|uniref:Uncharacterized protein n=1 Tax=Cytospora chrysosperma TaxID=252740 RepID=A0A423WLA1_CYTCH|nr:hypothetical protein VSDG_01038 [Valsa sordida]
MSQPAPTREDDARSRAQPLHSTANSDMVSSRNTNTTAPRKHLMLGGLTAAVAMANHESPRQQGEGRGKEARPDACKGYNRGTIAGSYPWGWPPRGKTVEAPAVVELATWAGVLSLFVRVGGGSV